VADWPAETQARRAPVSVTWANPGAADSLCRRFGMDEASVASRREFVRLGEEDRQLLSSMAAWAAENAPTIAREFYDWQFQYGPTREFFEGMARQKSIPLSTLRKALEAAQSGYITEVFAGAEVNWDLRYFEKRLGVGTTHDRINLPFKWYVASYTEFQRLLGEYLRRDLRDADRMARIELAVNRVFNLDLQAIGDAFMLNTLQGMLGATGITLADIGTVGDKSEQVGEGDQLGDRELHHGNAAHGERARQGRYRRRDAGRQVSGRLQTDGPGRQRHGERTHRGEEEGYCLRNAVWQGQLRRAAREVPRQEGLHQ
jgi:hypothetical protein